ncbi:peptide deformylase [candidate division WOR-1 bacterium RIFOXYA12_FULL_43_27]|uniref:Peptide deformylase n=1 Tax=candidate division WOR-1 bacterium RIFOXYC2_FULL_46_14 TaxID=1802587 RepID=A0A1F4U4W7_UNCSA|nr:MAG: peptide deformylase [candidate division WOR-1 bacterium RIFOXYA12_FULL_43_27]OGC20751.1 MAG: peptide deformylase [candidate division WOR-1 bacterium RIFOXYB2_FULL_46_45]OGC31512.1 MAG: peptide deformylase [candidate division WOR-1 bacterium RIFOXYA2_FULL_46_56]OGC39919.1 MAG: peptide deformylase [candidate division WOR-1 bacterium RIFOXYC2_FULL_46_14]
MILNILKYPDPLLKKKSKGVKSIDDKIKKLIKDMIETMLVAPGVGLAAPQVAQLVRVITVDVSLAKLPPEEKNSPWTDKPFGLVNPKIKKRSGSQTFEEGCLCLPGIVGPVQRYSDIIVEALDKNGKNVTIHAKGFLATVLQHEIDHLEGTVFIDRIKDKTLIRSINPKDEPSEDKL